MPSGIYPRKTLEERFWAKVEKTETCWVWKGYINKATHYGAIRINGKSERVHIISYKWANGFIPNGMELDHLCRNRACVNPDHLEPIIHRDNVMRGISIIAKNAFIAHCPQGHPYDLFNTYRRPDNGRDCRICQHRRIIEFRLRRLNS